MKEKKKRKLFVALLVVIIITGLGVGGLFFYKETEYKKAFELLQEIKPLDAKEIFSNLGDYKNAGEMITECDYIEAKCILLDCKYDEAKENFLAISDYKDSAELAILCDYRKALTMLEEGKLQEAAKAFTSLGDFQDSSDMVKECKYREALSLTDSKYFDAHMTIMEDTGMFNFYKMSVVDYRFEWKGIKLPDNAVNGDWDCTKSYDLSHYDMSDWSKDEEARDRLIQLGDYSNSREMVYEITKIIGSKMYSQGLFDMAKEEFDKYPEDAEFQFFSKACLYKKARELCKERNFVDAGVILEKLIKDKEFLDLFYGENCSETEFVYGERTYYYNRQDGQESGMRYVDIEYQPENLHGEGREIIVASIQTYLYSETGEQLELYTFYPTGSFMCALDIVNDDIIEYNPDGWPRDSEISF